MLEIYKSLLRSYILEKGLEMTREPAGLLKHPYVAPTSITSPYYTTDLWDWDSWMSSVALGQVELELKEDGKFALYEEGAIKNFLDYTGVDGNMPIKIDDQEVMSVPLTDANNPYSQNMHKPVIVQHVAMLVQRNRQVEWIKPYMPKLEAFLNRYLTSHYHEATGLLYWQSDFAIGVDNDPSVYYMPDCSCASIYLNSLFYRELLAYGYLLEQLNLMEEANVWRGKAQDLAAAINKHCWDERDGNFYSVSINLREVDESEWLHSGAPRTWDSVLLRIDNWSSFLPMWAGIATTEKAERMVQRLLEERTYNAAYGIRTLSKQEKMYDLRASNNPSNWLGPIWGLSNYMVFRGLVKYGYHEAATELAEKTIRLFGQDLETNGSLHEYYHPDNGEPIVTPEFQNWNFLVLQMIAYVDKKPLRTEF